MYILDEKIETAQEQISDQITPYLRRSLKEHKHQVWALNILEKMAEEKKKFTVIDIGCGIGLLGAYLLSMSFNAHYIGVDKEEKFLQAGRELFLRLSYWPQLYKRDFYKDSLPMADIAVFMGCEDQLTGNYAEIFNIINHYDDILISIVGYDMWEYTKVIKTSYPFAFVPEDTFEKIFCTEYFIKEKETIQRGRVLYWLQRRSI